MSPTIKGSNWKNKVLGVLATVAVVTGGFAGYKEIRDIVAPPTEGTCLVSNRTDWGPTYEPGDCDFGFQINRTNASWTCSVALSSLGALPIRVVIASTGAWSDAAAVNLDSGCSGDGNNDTIDLLVEVAGTGQDGGTGINGDVMKFRPFSGPGPQNIQLTITGDCGPGGGHFDFWQNQSDGGTNLSIVNGETGDYANGIPTCQGAGGAIFWSDSADVNILGGEYVACNHGLNGNGAKSGSGSIVTDAKFRTGAASGGNCQGVVISPACINTQGMTLVSVTSQMWNGSSYATSACTP